MELIFPDEKFVLEAKYVHEMQKGLHLESKHMEKLFVATVNLGHAVLLDDDGNEVTMHLEVLEEC